MNSIIVYPNGKLIWENQEFRCALGKSGISKNKREGDGATPAGCFPVKEVFYRSDRIKKPETIIPTRPLNKNDGWCDDPKDKNYNKFVKLPYFASAESLWRNDNLYDIIITLGYNDSPPIPEKGSAIFIHTARPNYSPTAGCIALVKPDIRKLLKKINKESLVCIKESVKKVKK